MRLFINKYEEITKIILEENKELIIGTDQNLDFIKLNQHKLTENFLELNLSSGIIPTITKPTRITHQTATLIDNIYLKSKHVFDYKSGIVLADLSDHLPCVLFCRTGKRLKPEPLTFKHRKITDDALVEIKSHLSGKNWDYLNNLSPEDGFSEFTSQINKSLDKFTPERCISIPAKHIINEPWMTPGLMTSSKKCGKLFSKIIGNDKASPGYLKYIAYRNKLNSIKRKAKFAFYHNKINMFRNNSSKLWKLMKQIIGKQNNKTSLTDTFIINNLPNTNPTTISNSFCEYFSTIGNKLAANIPKSKKFPHEFTQGEYSDSFFMAPTDQNEIQKIIMKLKPKKSAGHDKLNSIM